MAQAVAYLGAELQLRADDFNKKLKDARKESRAFQKRWGMIGDQLGKIGKTMGAVGGAVVGSIGLMINSTREYSREIQIASDMTGLSTQRLQELRFAAEQTGGQFDDVVDAATEIAVKARDAATGSKDMADVFASLGIATTDLSGNLRSSEELLLEVGTALGTMEDRTLAAVYADELLSDAGKRLLPTFAGGKEGIAAYAAEAHKLGIVLDKQAIAKSNELDQVQKKLRTAFAGMSGAVSDVFTPVLVDLGKQLTEAIVWVKELTKAHPDLVKWIGIAAGVLTGVGGLLVGLSAVIAIAPAVGTAFTVMTGPVGIIITVVGGLILAFIAWRKEIYSGFLRAVSAVLDALAWLAREVADVSALMGLDGFAGSVRDLAGELEESARGLEDKAAAVMDHKEATDDLIGSTDTLTTSVSDLALAVGDAQSAAEDATPKLFDMSETTTRAQWAFDDAKAAAEGTKTAVENIPGAPDIVDADWLSDQTNILDQLEMPDLMDEAWRTSQADVLNGWVDDVEQSLDDYVKETAKANREAKRDYERTFNDIKGAFGDMFEAMITGGENPIRNIAEYFKNTFSSIFFEEILGAWVASFVTPLVQKLRNLLIEGMNWVLGKLADLLGIGFGGIGIPGTGGGGSGGGTGGRGSGQGGQGGGGGGMAGFFNWANLATNIADAIIGGFQRARLEGSLNKIEENTRKTSRQLVLYMQPLANEMWPYMKHSNDTLWVIHGLLNNMSASLDAMKYSLAKIENKDFGGGGKSYGSGFSGKWTDVSKPDSPNSGIRSQRGGINLQVTVGDPFGFANEPSERLFNLKRNDRRVSLA